MLLKHAVIDGCSIGATSEVLESVHWMDDVMMPGHPTCGPAIDTCLHFATVVNLQFAQVRCVAHAAGFSTSTFYFGACMMALVRMGPDQQSGMHARFVHGASL